MQFEVLSSTVFASTPCDAWVVSLFEDGLESPWAEFEEATGSIVGRALASGEFKPTASATFGFHVVSPGMPARVMVVGLGKQARFTAQMLGRAYAAGLRQLRDTGCKRVGVLLPPTSPLAPEDATQAIVEHAIVGCYEFRRYKTSPEPTKTIESLMFRAPEGAEAGMQKALEVGQVLGDCANFTRDIANEIPAVATPSYVAERAQELSSLGLHCTVLDEMELASRGMNAILAVGQGSAHPPRLVALEYRPEGVSADSDIPLYAVVGKGVTFDSGGLSLKPAASMEGMKFDKSGACAVLGILRAVALLRLPVRVLGVLGLAENMPSGQAYRPGDIVRAASGKTIEVLNTDAEGRLVLADALHYAGLARPKAMVDLATLTGAVIIALGDQAAGIMGTDDRLISDLIAAGERTGERLWQLPLWPEYDEKVKSEVADLKNIGERAGGMTQAGTIAGASFLKAFVPEGCAWAHLDIAAMADDGKKRSYRAAGATGFGVRIVVDWLRAAARG